MGLRRFISKNKVILGFTSSLVLFYMTAGFFINQYNQDISSSHPNGWEVTGIIEIFVIYPLLYAVWKEKGLSYTCKLFGSVFVTSLILNLSLAYFKMIHPSLNGFWAMLNIGYFFWIILPLAAAFTGRYRHN